MLRSFSLYILLLCCHPAFVPHALVSSAAAAGSVKLYDDFNCNHPSTLNPTVSLPLSVCLVTTGGEGLVIGDTPPCPQSTATLIYYSDTACGVTTDNAIANQFSPNCFELGIGGTLYNAKSVMFSCQPAANNPQPSSTTTAVVSALAAVATGSTPDSGGGNSAAAAPSSATTGSTSSSAAASGSTPTDTTSPKGAAGSNGANGTNGSSSSTSSPTSGLGTGDIIAIAVGLGIGIPTILIMLATWLLPNFRYRLMAWFHIGGGRHHGSGKGVGAHLWPGSHHSQEMSPQKQEHSHIHFHG